MDNICEVVITILGILITAVISISNIKRQIYASSVSNSRNKWLIDLREELGEIVKVLKYINTYEKNKQNIVPDNNSFFKDISIRMEGEKAKTIISSKLNVNSTFGNEYNIFLLEKLEMMDFMSTNTYEEKFIDSVEMLTKKILENEWVKVKKEAKGKPSNKEEHKCQIQKWSLYISAFFLLVFLVLGYFILDTVDTITLVVVFVTVFSILLLIIFFFLLNHIWFSCINDKLDNDSKKKQEEAKIIASV